MAQKLWEKSVQVNEEIDRFTVGKDRELDLYLAKHDVLGSMAHITMLESIGLLSADELQVLLAELKNIYASAERGEFVIEDGIEDVHSQVELMLTRKLGDVGKKIHSGRSRNDQVLVDLKLFTREQLKQIAEAVEDLFHVLISQSNKYKDVLMPGYTHLQIAMPSSFGLWFGAYAESLVDDMMFLQAAYKMCNRNPLGSAAGYGSSFPLDREMTTRLLGFDSMNYNVVYAQMGRGKMERNVAFALASIAGTISKMAFDACMFSSQNFGFVKLPDECTTGSSIMPHKKNPDVFELTRAKCNKLQSLPQQIMMIMNNLPSGYFRDLQIIKEVFLPAFEELKDCLRMSAYIMDKIKVNEHILDDDKYLYIFSVEEVNRLAAEADLLVAEGFIEPHFFAGFSGGRKSILPGVASRETVMYNHNSGFINDPHARTGVVEGNPIHNDMLYAARAARLDFIVNVVIDAAHDPIFAVAGDCDLAHRVGREFLASKCQVDAIPADIVISTNDGYPLDQNIYQSVKGMTAAEATVKEGGVIIMLSKAADGHGGKYFHETFRDEKDLNRMMKTFLDRKPEETIIDQWQSQIFARLLLKATVVFVSSCDDQLVEDLHMVPAHSMEEALEKAKAIVKKDDYKVTVIPDGVSVIVRE